MKTAGKINPFQTVFLMREIEDGISNNKLFIFSFCVAGEITWDKIAGCIA